MNGDFDIVNIYGREIIDSEGMPAVEALVTLENGAVGKACAIQSQADRKSEFTGGYLAKGISHILGEAVLFEDASNQRRIDHLLLEQNQTEEMRGSVQALSMAVSRAAAAGHKMPLYRYLGGVAPARLPIPLVTVLSRGGTEEGQWEEITVAPLNTTDFSEGFFRCASVYRSLKKLLAVCGRSDAVGRTGGLSLEGCGKKEALEYVSDAMKLCGCVPGKDALIIQDLCVPADLSALSSPALAGLSGALTVSMDQALTVTQAVEQTEAAKREGRPVIAAHGKRETEDIYMADFAAAARCDFLKMGAPCRAEWTSKYNEVLRLEEWMKHFYW